MKVYSPSQTARAMECPMKNALYREGWRPLAVGMPSLASLAGRTIAAGLAQYAKYRRDHEQSGGTVDTMTPTEREHIAKSALAEALAFVDREMEATIKLGLIVDEGTYLKQMVDRIGKTLTQYILRDPLPASWRIVAIEKDYGEEYGNARPDLVIRNEFGLAIVDYKTYSTSRANKRAEFQESHQMKHYCYFGKAAFGEDLTRYYIMLLSTDRWNPQLEPYELTQEGLDLWYQATVPMWKYMEQIELGNELPWMAASHETKWGPCEFYDACFRYRFDEQAMKSKYVKVERKVA